VNAAGPVSSVSDLSAKFAALPTTPALAVNQNIAVTLNVTNVGPNDKAAGRTLSIVRSSSLNFVSASVNGLAGSCTEAAGTITCTLPAITANQNASVNIVVKPTAPGIVGLTADLATSSDDPSNSNNTDGLSFTIPTP
jgi:large repetitive protein